jgi:hypothetical protein
MAMRYGYFDSEITGTDSEGMPIFDRAETSELFALFFSKLVTNGVLAKPATCFQVLAGDSGLTIKVQPGFGMVNGRFAYDNAEALISLDKAPTSYSRIDRVVLRCNYLNRLCEIIVKAGTAASSPVAPELLQPTSGDYYELGLATIKISANQTVLTQSAITDTRADSSVCGYITQLIDSIDTSTLMAQLNTYYDEFVAKCTSDYNISRADYLAQCQEIVKHADRVREYIGVRLQYVVRSHEGPAEHRRSWPTCRTRSTRSRRRSSWTCTDSAPRPPASTRRTA